MILDYMTGLANSLLVITIILAVFTGLGRGLYLSERTKNKSTIPFKKENKHTDIIANPNKDIKNPNNNEHKA